MNAGRNVKRYLDGKAYVVKINRLTEISAAKLPPYLSLLIDVTD